MNEASLDDLQRAARLEAMGVHVRSAELTDLARRTNDFHANGGNRAMRRAAARTTRKRIR